MPLKNGAQAASESPAHPRFVNVVSDCTEQGSILHAGFPASIVEEPNARGGLVERRT